MGFRKLKENDEEVLEVYSKRKGISPYEFKDLLKNYPSNIKKFKRNYWINKKGTGITDRGKSVFLQHKMMGSYWVMPLKFYKGLKSK